MSRRLVDKMSARLTVVLVVIFLCCLTTITNGHPHTTQAPLPVSICFLDPDPGSCRVMISRFYYEPKSDSCQPFLYGGCDGNANNFVRELDCLARCHGIGKKMYGLTGKPTSNPLVTRNYSPVFTVDFRPGTTTTQRLWRTLYDYSDYTNWWDKDHQDTTPRSPPNRQPYYPPSPAPESYYPSPQSYYPPPSPYYPPPAPDYYYPPPAPYYPPPYYPPSPAPESYYPPPAPQPYYPPPAPQPYYPPPAPEPYYPPPAPQPYYPPPAPQPYYPPPAPQPYYPPPAPGPYYPQPAPQPYYPPNTHPAQPYPPHTHAPHPTYPTYPPYPSYPPYPPYPPYPYDHHHHGQQPPYQPPYTAGPQPYPQPQPTTAIPTTLDPLLYFEELDGNCPGGMVLSKLDPATRRQCAVECMKTICMGFTFVDNEGGRGILCYVKQSLCPDPLPNANNVRYWRRINMTIVNL